MKAHHKALISLIVAHVGEPETGAEVGVWKAETSEVLADAFPCCFLTLVDPWCEWGSGTSYRTHHRRTGSLTTDEWEAVYEEAVKRIKATAAQFVIHRVQSSLGAAMQSDGSLDFTFIDANHTYESVAADIGYWLPKTRRLICGHDYGGTYRGVKRAVDEAFGDRVIDAGGRVWGVLVDG